MMPQGSCLSTLLCSLFLADLESNHLQDLLPRASWRPSAHMSPDPHPRPPHIGFTPSSSSAARLTDLAQAADTGMQLPPSTRLSQQSMGIPSLDEVRSRVSSVDLDCDAGQEDQWLTQHVQSLPLTGGREALAGTGAAAASSALAQSAMVQSSGAQSAATQSAAALSAAAQSAGSHGAAHDVQSASAAPSQALEDADCLPDSAGRWFNSKRPRRSLLNQLPAQAGSGVQQQAALPSRNADVSAAGFEWRQQSSVKCEAGQHDCWQQSSMAAQGPQQAPWQGQPGHSEDHEDQSHPCEVKAPKGSVRQSPTEAAGSRRGAERRAPRLQSLLMRLIDDFLFITPSRTAAEALVNKLLKGAQLPAPLPCTHYLKSSHLQEGSPYSTQRMLWYKDA